MHQTVISRIVAIGPEAASCGFFRATIGRPTFRSAWLAIGHVGKAALQFRGNQDRKHKFDFIKIDGLIPRFAAVR